jgi:predicted enzyme related to lactoylglutathione lyase
MSKPGSFFWYELMTTDLDAAEAFYAKVIGWNRQDFGSPEMRYTVVQVGDRGVGGMMILPDHLRAAGVPPCWGGYIQVEDADAEAAAIAAAGGAIHKAPDDIPGVGRFAVVADPQGAVFNILAPTGEEQPEPPAFTPGTAGWHELYTSDEKAAFGFYSGRYGWKAVRAMDMGAMGTYRIFGWDGSDRGNGGMMTHPQPGAPPAWLFYFCVEDIDAAAERVREQGGEVLMGPMEVPDGSWIIQANDPQGARFALVARKG